MRSLSTRSENRTGAPSAAPHARKKKKPRSKPGPLKGVNHKPGSVPQPRRSATGDGHFSRPAVAHGLQQPTRSVASEDRTGPPRFRRNAAAAAWSCTRWGLPCHRRHRRRGALLPHPFTLTCAPAIRRSTRSHRRCALCCAVPERAVTSPPGGRYPPPCPVVPGLSSCRRSRSPATRGRHVHARRILPRPIPLPQEAPPSPSPPKSPSGPTWPAPRSPPTSSTAWPPPSTPWAWPVPAAPPSIAWPPTWAAKRATTFASFTSTTPPPGSCSPPSTACPPPTCGPPSNPAPASSPSNPSPPPSPKPPTSPSPATPAPSPSPPPSPAARATSPPPTPTTPWAPSAWSA